MPRTTKRQTAPRDADSVEHRLARLLDAPSLARIVPHLPPETLHQLIRRRGLEACVELVTAATPAQLTSLLDLDLWRHAEPGRDDQFDVERFGEWLEALINSGDAIAARTVAALDTPLVILGLSRYVRVFDPGTFEPTAASDDEAVDRHGRMNSEATGDETECEVGGYLLRARRTDAWDAIVALLIALEAEHNDDFHALMQGCRRLSNSTPEIDGLDDLLMAPEQHGYDVAVERERRRSRQGYATPADARAFLEMARHPRATSTTPINPVAGAYFRAADEQGEPEHDAPDVLATRDEDIATSIDEAIELLAEAGAMQDRPRALLAAGPDDPRTARIAVLRRLMAYVVHADETAYLARSRELAFLANALIAGCSVQSRPFTPEEASDAAACVCNLGLESSGATLPDAFLADHDLVAAFEAGWAVLHRDVSVFVADQLISQLGALHAADEDTRDDLRALRRALERHRDAGTPWLARDAADVLATLDTAAWISVLGLLDECPIVPAALTAILERRTTSVSQTAFEFISTRAQIRDIHQFVARLPGLFTPSSSSA
jgi:Family of unknown function (DUF6178)